MLAARQEEPPSAAASTTSQVAGRDADHEALDLLAGVWPADVPLDGAFLRHVLQVRGLGHPEVDTHNLWHPRLLRNIQDCWAWSSA